MTEVIVCRLHKGTISQRPQVQCDVAGAHPPCAAWVPVPLGHEWRTVASQTAADLAVRRGVKNRLLLAVAWERHPEIVVYTAEEQKS